MSFATNIQDLATRISTEVKALRTLINGNAADLSALDTTAKTNLVAAINEVQQLAEDAASSGGATNLDGLSDVVITTPATGHVIRHNGTNFVNVLGTTHFEVAGAAASAQAAAIAASQPVDADLTAIAALTTTTYGRALLTLADQAALMALVPASSETLQGKVELATQTETNTGTDDARAVTPLKLQTRLAAYAQPLDSDLTSIAALSTTNYGRALLELANQASLMALLAAATETTSGIVELASTAEVTTGTDTTRAVTPAGVKAATDAVKTAILGAGVPAALDTLDELAAALGDDANFAATVTTALGNKQPIDSDLTAIAALVSAANKLPYATGAGTWALADFTAFGRSLMDDGDAATARATLSVYSQADIGSPTTDFVATFEAGLL